MNTNIESNFNYNDFSDLARLKVDAQKDSKEALKEVAKQFESVFVQMMIKSMRDASVPLQGDLFHDNQSKAYTDMYDKQLGLELSKNNGIGLADVIVRQLTPQVNSASNKSPTQSQVSHSINLNSIPVNADTKYSALTKNQIEIKTAAVSSDNHVIIKNIEKSPHWNTPEDFIRDSWPHAQKAGKALGVDPKVIIAQSVLETGWGKKVHVNEKGENSYSLFGIKAGKNWAGSQVQFNTLEFKSGVMSREKASFRSYDSLAESYKDYVDFLQQNPRYKSVVNANTSKEYSEQLQKAGYATDPNYSSKIERISNSDLINKVISELKISSKEPLV